MRDPRDHGVVIIGAGNAGGELTGALRQGGYSGSITLIGDEPYRPYRRPPLSKTFLAGEVSLESLFLKSTESYTQSGIDCQFGTGVESIDRDGRSIRLYDGTLIPFRWLVFATGGRPRRLLLPGADKPNVHYVRTIDDILKLKTRFIAGKRLAIVGGGYIGLEAASVGIKKELDVTLVEALPRVLARVTAPEVSVFYEHAHRKRGVKILTAVGVHALHGDSEVDALELTNGTRLSVDLVIVGIGLIPNTELADSIGLEVANGIVVGADTRTADSDIFAIGDCSNHDNAFLGRRLRLESVPNAAEQARVCAAAICGKPLPAAGAPWFWSDQFDLKLQMVGISEGYDQCVIRGDMAQESFIAFYLRDQRIVAADAVNRPQEFMISKRLVAERRMAQAVQLEQASFALKSVLLTP